MLKIRQRAQVVKIDQIEHPGHKTGALLIAASAFHSAKPLCKISTPELSTKPGRVLEVTLKMVDFWGP